MFGEKRSCPYCEGINIIQIYKHDSWACIDCNEWLEEPCNDANCPYCGGRPETPYEVYWNTDFKDVEVCCDNRLFASKKKWYKT